MSGYEIAGGVLTINGISVIIDAPGNYDRYRQRDDVLFMAKGVDQINAYADLATRLAKKCRPVRDVVEVGVFRGGSAVFLHQFLGSPNLVCIEYDSRPVPLLEDYRSTQSNVKTFYGIDQADRVKMLETISTECPDGMDLVIDDASHWYEETRSTFETLFPLMRPGGLYVIEDWGWPHNASAQGPDHFWAHKAALTNLLFELIVAFASGSGAFGEVHCVVGFAYIERGSGALPTDGTFRLDNYLLTRGKKISLI